jgi:hypothetical protein
MHGKNGELKKVLKICAFLVLTCGATRKPLMNIVLFLVARVYIKDLQGDPTN